MSKSELLPLIFAPLLFFKEQQERFALEKEEIAILLFWLQKTSDLHEEPKSKFPTLFLFLVDSVVFWYLKAVNGREHAGESDEGEEVPSVGCHHDHHKGQPEASHHLHTGRKFSYKSTNIWMNWPQSNLSEDSIKGECHKNCDPSCFPGL